MSGHLVMTEPVDYPDGVRRVLFRCLSADGCLEGHVEATPAAAADALAAQLVTEHERTGLWLGGLVEVGGG